MQYTRICMYICRDIHMHTIRIAIRDICVDCFASQMLEKMAAVITAEGILAVAGDDHWTGCVGKIST